MISTVKLTGPAVTAACPALSASHPEGLVVSALSGFDAAPSAAFRLRGLGRAGLSASAVRGLGKRPAETAVAADVRAAANGAGHRTEWRGDARSFAYATAGIRMQQPKRAFRGLEPWRDPA